MRTDRPPPGVPVLITLDEASVVPKYQQIADQIRALVANGTLLPGTPIPSVRQLAMDLGINMNTVLAAYRELEAEQVVLLRRGSRATIHPRLARPSSPTALDVEKVRALLARVRVTGTLAGLSLDEMARLASETFSGADGQAPVPAKG